MPAAVLIGNTGDNRLLEYGWGGWTRTNACKDQNLVPYQLGDTPKNIVILSYFQSVSKLAQGGSVDPSGNKTFDACERTADLSR